MKNFTLTSKNIKSVFKTLKEKISKYNKEIPECYRDEKYLFCYCGKCEQECYKLSEDSKKFINTTQN